MTRTYGEGTYGSGFYGDGVPLATEPTWVDVTPTAFEIDIVRGDTEGRLTVPVSEATIRYLDVPDDDVLFPFSPSLDAQRPRPGTFARVSVVGPDGEFYPLFVGRTESIVDEHDEGQRTVTVQAFGVESDLSTSLAGWDRPNAEFTSTRLVAATTDAGWTWADWEANDPDIPWPDEPTPQQRDVIVDPSTGITALAAIDQAANSAGWYYDHTLDGRPRVGRYPVGDDGGRGDLFEVVDCKGDPDAPASHRIVYASDLYETLNVVEIVAPETPGGAAERVVVEVDGISIGQVGRRSEALGFPIRNSTAFSTTDEPFAQRVLARYKDTLVRVSEVQADSAVDPRWLDYLYQMDRGRPILIRRTGLEPNYPLTVAAYVVGHRHTLTRNRWRAQVFTTTDAVTG